MFELVDVADHIPLPAQAFPTVLAPFPLSPGTSSPPPPGALAAAIAADAHTTRQNTLDTRARFRLALLSAIAAKHLFRVVPGVGLAVTVVSLNAVATDTMLLPGQASVWVRCTFTLAVFRPCVGDRLRARIVGQSLHGGIRLSLDFFDQIFVPPSMLADGSEWEPTLQQWGIRDPDGFFIRYTAVTMPNASSAASAAASSATAGAADGVDAAAVPPAAAAADAVAAAPNLAPDDAAAAAAASAPSTKASLLAAPTYGAGSVICCVEKVEIVDADSNATMLAQRAGATANAAASANADGAPGVEPAPISAMRIVASFSSCPGLGPEAWFAEE
jgi:hypothetical protein